MGAILYSDGGRGEKLVIVGGISVFRGSTADVYYMRLVVKIKWLEL